MDHTSPRHRHAASLGVFYLNYRPNYQAAGLAESVRTPPVTFRPLLVTSSTDANGNLRARTHAELPHPTRRIISSGSEDAWEHVSVSCPNRCPTWEEMARVNALFWSDEETVLQFHPRKADYINRHHYCLLHLWKRRNEEFVLPPSSPIA